MEGANYRLTSDRVEEGKTNMIFRQEHGIFLDSRHIPTFSQTAPKPAASDSPFEDISLEILGENGTNLLFTLSSWNHFLESSHSMHCVYSIRTVYRALLTINFFSIPNYTFCTALFCTPHVLHCHL